MKLKFAKGLARGGFACLLAFLIAGTTAPAQTTETKATAGEKAKPAPAKPDAKSEAILRKLAARFQKVKSAEAGLSMKMKLDLPSFPTPEMGGDYSFAVQKPNRFALVLKNGQMGSTAISDGTKLVRYVPPLNKYTETNAPTDLRTLGEAGDLDGGIENVGIMGSLFAPDPYTALLAGVKSVEFLGVEQIDKVEHAHLKAAQEDGDWEAWIRNDENSSLAKVVLDLKKQLLKQAPPQMAEFLKNAKAELTLTFRDWKLDQPIDAAVFKFVPPQGATKVASFSPAEEETDAAEEGDPAPDFKLDLLDGGKLELAKHKGKHIVILDFWATWCGPCVKALPLVIKTAEAYKDKDVVFFALNQQEKPEEVREFISKKGWKLQVAMDTEGGVGEKYGVQGIPQTVIIDKEGILRVVHVGFDPDMSATLAKDLDDIIAGKKAPAKASKAAKKEAK